MGKLIDFKNKKEVKTEEKKAPEPNICPVCSHEMFEPTYCEYCANWTKKGE
jgi:hypothetical protein